ncbi:MAG: hypothetical protein JO027_04490 [Solirubrobacterales bacterium]|nr:hypothetical protein [Solirubrobacterales bacterium]
MTDLPSSLGIEAVECVSEGGPSLTVRVIGRWRRRPEPRGQATLVVETDAGRQRFPAMPEPPSLTGAAPGTWRMSFSVPAALAPALPGRTFLQLGGVMVPLPIGEVTITQGPGPELLEARRARGSELAAESARRRVAELSAEVNRLESELGEARAQSDRLKANLAEGARRLRSAEQHAHAESALRADLEQELTRRSRSAQHDLRALHDHVAELERELGRLRRAVDEAGHLAAAAESARAAAESARAAAETARVQAERRLAERAAPAPAEPSPAPAEPSPPPAAADGARGALSRLELEFDHAARDARPAVPAPRPAERAGDRRLLAAETGLVRRRGQPADPRPAELARDLAAAREEAEAQRRRSARAYEAIALVRAELAQIRAATPPERPASAPTAPPPPPSGRPAPAGSVQPEELSAALARLRERTPPPDPAPDEAPPPDASPAPDDLDNPGGLAVTVDPPEPPRPARPWLYPVFRRLAATDASTAGRLVLALLPAQRAVDPQPVAYDLVLSDVLVAHVTSDSLGMHVERDATPRPAAELDFQLVGDLASLARLLRAGRVRRRLRVPPGRMARVRGDRRRLAALDRLLDARLTLGELALAGVRLDPVLAFTLAGLMIDPAWTTGERFVLGHREPAASAPGAYLHIRDGRPPLAAGEEPHGPVAGVLVCQGEDLLRFLGGAGGPDLEVAGAERPVALVRQWLDRAQCG